MKIILMQWEATTPRMPWCAVHWRRQRSSACRSFCRPRRGYPCQHEGPGLGHAPGRRGACQCRGCGGHALRSRAVVKQHPNSSLVLGARMLAQGGGDAFISAGNTGALLTAATLLVKRIRGIRRAAFSPVLPTKDGHAILIDAGARMPSARRNSCCSSAAWARSTRRRRSASSRRAWALNNGAGRYEGRPAPPRGPSASEARRGAGDHPLRRQCRGARWPFGAADVIVADGFSGNVLLKTMEGTAMFMSGMMKQMFYRNPLTMLGALLCKGPERHPQDHGLPRNGRVHRHRHQPPGHQGARLVRRRRCPRRGSGRPSARSRAASARKFVPISGR